MPNNLSSTDDWAIVVGISRYPELGDLGGPENDARKFYEWVTSPAGGGVPDVRAKPLLSSHFPPFSKAIDALPTEEKVLRLFEELDELAQLRRAAGELTVGRRLYLYFCGHGCATDFEDAALIMANATPRRIYHVPGKPWADYFFRAGYFREIVLFMDCCRERQERVFPSIPPWLSQDLPEALDEGRRFYGFGAKWSRTVREKEYPLGSGKFRGVFTLALLDGLTGAAYDPTTQFTDQATGKLRAHVTSSSLGNFLYNNLKSYLSLADMADPLIAKNPDLVYDREAVNSLIFATVDVPLFSVEIRLPSGLRSGANGMLLQIRRENFAVILEQYVAGRFLTVSLSRGNYEARIRGTGHEGRLFQVTGVTGATNVVCL
jgi:hypothetical protein